MLKCLNQISLHGLTAGISLSAFNEMYFDIFQKSKQKVTLVNADFEWRQFSFPLTGDRIQKRKMLVSRLLRSQK